MARYRSEDPRIAALFQASHIQTRHLYLPEPDADGVPRETQGELLAKHLRGALELGPAAIDRALAPLGLAREAIDHLTVVTTTGFLSPGLSAHLVREMGLRPDVARMDVVGMGCNAGLNALEPVSAWAQANPGKVGVQVSVEVCSAAYVYDGTLRTAVVNSLFGDGAAAIVVSAGSGRDRPAPAVLAFERHMIVDALGAMRFDWDAEAGKFSFYLDPDVPYAVGAHVATPVDRLLERFGLKRRDVAHWIVHSGGKKVVDAIKYNLGLTSRDVRHTTSVLRDYGNVSSGSFLFSYERLLAEGEVREGDWAVMMTMGPGSQIETALLRF